MKKFLCILSSLAIGTLPAVSVVSCAGAVDPWHIKKMNFEYYNKRFYYSFIRTTFTSTQQTGDGNIYDISNYQLTEMNDPQNNSSNKQVRESSTIRIINIWQINVGDPDYLLVLNREINIGSYLKVAFNNQSFSTSVVPPHSTTDNSELLGATVTLNNPQVIEVIVDGYPIWLDSRRYALSGSGFTATTITGVHIHYQSLEASQLQLTLSSPPKWVQDQPGLYYLSYTNTTGQGQTVEISVL